MTVSLLLKLTKLAISLRGRWCVGADGWVGTGGGVAIIASGARSSSGTLVGCRERGMGPMHRFVVIVTVNTA